MNWMKPCNRVVQSQAAIRTLCLGLISDLNHALGWGLVAWALVIPTSSHVILMHVAG